MRFVTQTIYDVGVSAAALLLVAATGLTTRYLLDLEPVRTDLAAACIFFAIGVALFIAMVAMRVATNVRGTYREI